MNKTFALLASVAAIALAAPAFSADETIKSETKIERDNDGSYTKTTSQKHDTDAGATSAKTKVDVDVNKDGTVEKTTTTKEVNDPDGLMNKDTVKTKEKVKTHKDGTTSVEHKKTVNGKTVEETETKH